MKQKLLFLMTLFSFLIMGGQSVGLKVFLTLKKDLDGPRSLQCQRIPMITSLQSITTAPSMCGALLWVMEYNRPGTRS